MQKEPGHRVKYPTGGSLLKVEEADDTIKIRLGGLRSYY
jgi:hypothetical protein